MGEGAWICLDGVEGTGKTTISSALAGILRIEKAPEFSAAPFGRSLAGAVRSTPHYISTSPVGQSLVFLGDFLEVHASVVAPRLRAGVPVISDRGYLSKYAYQEVVLSDELGAEHARRLLDPVFQYLRPPALTISLTTPLDRLSERLIRRDGHCDDARRRFITRAADAAVQRLRRSPALTAVTVDTDRPLGDILSELVPLVRQVIRRSRSAPGDRGPQG